MGKIVVHRFISRDGVDENPRWTARLFAAGTSVALAPRATDAHDNGVVHLAHRPGDRRLRAR